MHVHIFVEIWVIVYFQNKAKPSFNKTPTVLVKSLLARIGSHDDNPNESLRKNNADSRQHFKIQGFRERGMAANGLFAYIYHDAEMEH